MYEKCQRRKLAKFGGFKRSVCYARDAWCRSDELIPLPALLDGGLGCGPVASGMLVSGRRSCRAGSSVSLRLVRRTRGVVSCRTSPTFSTSPHGAIQLSSVEASLPSGTGVLTFLLGLCSGLCTVSIGIIGINPFIFCGLAGARACVRAYWGACRAAGPRVPVIVRAELLVSPRRPH